MPKRTLFAVFLALAILAACTSRDADYARAYRDWLPAAQLGDADAQNNLGLLYSQGLGIDRDDEKAVFWWRKAAEQHFTAAQYNLAVAFRDGRGVAQNRVRALMWYEIAVRRSAQARGYRDALAGRMTANQIAKAQHLAAAWLKAHPGS